VGIVLVVGLVAANTYFASVNEMLGARADNQVAIGRAMLDAKVSMRETQMAARDMRLATSPYDAEDAAKAEQARLQEMVEKLEAAKARMTLSANIERVEAAIASATSYVDLSIQMLPILKRKMALPPGSVDLGVAKSLTDVQAQIDRASREEEEGESGESDGDLGDDEELYRQALDVLRSTRRASTSMIQRRLRIGYNRAARLMDLMEDKGIVGPENGSSPREILVDLDNL
jgi:DNA segregation ATPase FtsK/SpoIIIE-like protein